MLVTSWYEKSTSWHHCLISDWYGDLFMDMDDARGRAYLERPGPCWGYFKALIAQEDVNADERRRAEEKQQHSEEKRRKAEDDEGHGEEEEGFGEYDEGYGEEDGGFELSNMIRNSRDSKRYRLYGKEDMRFIRSLYIL